MGWPEQLGGLRLAISPVYGHMLIWELKLGIPGACRSLRLQHYADSSGKLQLLYFMAIHII